MESTPARTSPAPLTTEVFAIPYQDHYVIYAPRRRAAFVGSAAVVNFLCRLRTGWPARLDEDERAVYALLGRLGMLGPAGDLPASGLRGAFSPHEVTLFLTTACNLRCAYCYADGGSARPATMDAATARAGIDAACRFALAAGRRGFGVGYHGGGEPTRAWDLLTGSLAYARELAARHGLSVTATLATNGVLSPAQRRWIVANLQAVSLSLDGLPDVQDGQRPGPRGGRSSPAVMATLDAFERARFPYGVRMTVTAASAARLPASVSYLVARATPRRIQVEPVYDLGRARQPGMQVAPGTFVDAFRAAACLARAAGVDLFYSAARLDTLADRFCRSCGEGFSLTPDGAVSACYEIPSAGMPLAGEFIFGTCRPGSGLVVDESRLAALRAWNVESLPWCRECYCKWHCAGDCPHKTHQAMIDGEFRGHARCEITRALVLDQLVERIERGEWERHPLPPPSPSEGEGAHTSLTKYYSPLPSQRGRGWGRGSRAEGVTPPAT